LKKTAYRLIDMYSYHFDFALNTLQFASIDAAVAAIQDIVRISFEVVGKSIDH